MDESPLPLDPVRRTKGLKAERKRRADTMLRRAKLSLRRSVFTLIAFVSDDEATQRLLPQIIAGNKKLLPRRLASAHVHRSDNVYVLSRKSAWNNENLQCEIFRMVGSALAPLKETHSFLLSMDAHSVHLAPKVFRSADSAGLLPHIIPACMTSLLQPLDTHLFSKLKFELWKRRQNLLLKSAGGELTPEEYLALVCEVVNDVFCVSCPRAFASCGFSSGQGAVSMRVLNALEWSSVPKVASTLPTLEELKSISPGNGKREIAVLRIFGISFHEISLVKGEQYRNRARRRRPAELNSSELNSSELNSSELNSSEFSPSKTHPK